jgi:pimeloyl-ACP methyl ester carboxylesterase
MSDPKPTILFVHGAWHTPACFEPVRSLLEKAGYATSSPHLPTAKDILPLVDMNADAQCLHDELRKLVEEEERDVIIIAHSYGGVVTTQAVEQIFSQKERRKDGKKGGVERLVYITAILLGLNERVFGLLGGALSDVLSIDVSQPT